MKKLVLLALAVGCLYPAVPSWAALLGGVFVAIVMGNPMVGETKKLTPRLLTWSVMGLGAGMNLEVVFRVGAQGIGYTVVGIAFAFACGLLLARALRLEFESAVLITVGTAICGGSAIAAVAPTIRARSQSISVALGTVFLLNATALVIFPWLGHVCELSQTQFGLWAALAIHDTSSVVGAGLQYGAEALQVATTVKLARALWIIPVTLACGYLFASRAAAGAGDGAKPKRPWFILGFLIAAALVTYIPELRDAGHIVELIAKRALVLTLFLIGASLNWETLKSVGVKPFVHGFLLWLVVGSATLGGIVTGWIH